MLGAGPTYWLVRGESPRAILKPLCYAVVAAGIFVVPVAIWNTARTGELTVLSNNLGYNLRIGHAPYSTGRYIFPWTPFRIDPASDALPSESSAIRRSIDYAVHHPIDEIALSGKKVFYLYATDSDSIIWAASFGSTPIWGSSARGSHLMDLADGVVYATLILALVAVPLTFSLRDERLLLWLILAFWTAAHVVFFGEPRYHLAVLPIILTMSAVAIVEGWRALLSVMTAEPRTARAQPSPAGDGPGDAG